MKKKVFIMAAIVLMSGHLAQAGVSIVKNGSFENNGAISDITTKAPQYWCGINVPTAKFGGKVDTAWKTHGSYSLTLYSKAGKSFIVGEEAAVSQQVYLGDVNEIFFDIQLTGTHGSYPWDSKKFSAILRIDSNDIWDSKGLEPNNVNGSYSIEFNDVNVNDSNMHTLSLVMRANKSEMQITQYNVRWDFVKFDTHCGGFGYLPEDLNMDCYVDINDLGMLAEQWLETEPNYNDRYDLFIDDSNTINFYDYAVLAAGWLDNSDWRNWQADNCYEALPLDTDIDNDGVVNFEDFAVLANDWMKTKTVGCLQGDINCSGSVDYKDVAIMADEWLMTSWMYGLE